MLPNNAPRGGQPPGDHPRIGVVFPGKWIHHVIVCDDERHIVRLIQVNLARQGLEVRMAFNGRDCLEMVRSNVPDLLIIDREMPYMSGDEVVAALRAESATADLPIILLDRNSQNSDGGRPLPPGPSAVISKPFNPLDLMRLIP